MAYDPRTGTSTGGGAGGYDPAYGGIPQVPNLIDVYGQGLAANQQFLPQFTQIGAQITGANQQELLNNLRASIPGYDASVAQSSQNIAALQRGQIPTDVSNLLKQQAAERGIATGLYDSPNANAALLSALGLTSLGLQGEGEKQMSALVGRTPQAQPFDVSRLMMSPTDLYEQQLLANIYKAAPVPKAAAQQLIADQMAGYSRGRANVPSYSSGGVGGGGGGTFSPISPTTWASDRPNPPAVGALGPFAPTPAAYSPVRGNLDAGGGAWQYDSNLGAYYNQYTGEISDTPGGTPWQGMTWGGVNTPTEDMIDFGDVTGPTYEEDYGD